MNDADKPHKKPAHRRNKVVPGNVFDVLRPGRAPAASTSKPVILGHKSAIQDLMFAPADTKRSLLGHGKKAHIAAEPETLADKTPDLPPTPADLSDESFPTPTSVPTTPTPNPQTPSDDSTPVITPTAVITAPLALATSSFAPEPSPSTSAPSAAIAEQLGAAVTPAPSSAPTTSFTPNVAAPLSVADQLAVSQPPAQPSESIKPLPKEAFAAIAADNHRPVDTEGAIIHGPVVSHHNSHRHRWLWLVPFLFLAAAVVAAFIILK